VRTRTFNATFTHGLTSTMLNEVRAQFARDQEPGFANSENPEAIVRQGGSTVLTIGRNNFSPRETTIKRAQVADTVTWARGAHFLRVGGDLQFDRILNFFPGNFAGSYQFNSLASYQLGVPSGAGERSCRRSRVRARAGRPRIPTSMSTARSCRTSGAPAAT
jgi:hypothetical protein